MVKPVVLADIGEGKAASTSRNEHRANTDNTGIVECEIIQWFVQPGARVEEFSPLCEVQSDKASVEITSRFAGVVRKLHYEAGEMAKVGKPFVDIDLPEEELNTPSPVAEEEKVEQVGKTPEAAVPAGMVAEPIGEPTEAVSATATVPRQKFSGSSLATPAVRHLSKELKIDITQVVGTGKDGRVLKEDIHRFIAQQKSGASAAFSLPSTPGQTPAAPSIDKDAPQQETAVPIGGTQLQMFKAMTRSLTIPHFLYADEIDFTQLYTLRQRINASLAKSSGEGSVGKISYLPFVVKAVSMALNQYPILNARVEAASSTDASSKPRLVYRSQHNIGIAMDTPNGLLVPVVRNVNARSVLSIAGELVRLQGLAQSGKLAPADLQGGTITVSNIGNVGGTYLSPVIVEREVAILGMGRLRAVPAFADDSDEATGTASHRIVKRHVCHFSFSADHRVVDGATLARAAEIVRQMVERPDSMILQLR